MGLLQGGGGSGRPRARRARKGGQRPRDEARAEAHQGRNRRSARSCGARARIRRDGVLLGPAEWNIGVPVDPGIHAIDVGAPERKSWTSSVDLPAKPGLVSVTIPVLEAAPASAPETPEPTGAPRTVAPLATTTPRTWSTQRIAGAVVAGAGVLSLGVGVYFGLESKSTYDASNGPGHCVNNQCDSQGLQNRSGAYSQATVSTVLVGVGLAAVATGAVLYFTAPRETPSPGSLYRRWSPGAAGAWSFSGPGDYRSALLPPDELEFDVVVGGGPVSTRLGLRIADRYELEALLGRGGMGEVWRARHVALNSRGRHQVPSRRVGREGASAQALHYRGPDHGAAQDAGTPFRSSTSASPTTGGPTSSWSCSTARPLGHRLERSATCRPGDGRFLQQAARALDRAHALGIVHRDFKPDNWSSCKDEDGRDYIKVLDFGIAKLVGELEAATSRLRARDPVASTHSFTRTGTMLGTPLYMAPEQVRRDAARRARPTSGRSGWSLRVPHGAASLSPGRASRSCSIASSAGCTLGALSGGHGARVLRCLARRRLRRRSRQAFHERQRRLEAARGRAERGDR